MKKKTVTSSPSSVLLMLSVSGGQDAFGPFFATLWLTKEDVEKLLRRADVFRVGHKLDNELYQNTYFDYTPEFFESGGTWDRDTKPSDIKQVETIFARDRHPADGWKRVATRSVPIFGNVRRDYCKLVVAGSMSQERLGLVDFNWVACIKHTSVEIETCEIKEEDIRALLAKFPMS